MDNGAASDSDDGEGAAMHWGVARCVDGEGVVGDGECGGVEGEVPGGCETGNTDSEMGDAGDGRAAAGERCG